MKKYYTIFRQGILDSVAYGPVAFVWILVESVELLAPLVIWTAAVPIGNTFGGYSKIQIVFYYALASVVKGLTTWYTHFNISQGVRTGDFSNYLTKPIPPLVNISFEELGWKVIRFFVHIPLIIFIAYFLITNLSLGTYYLNILFLLSIVLGSILSLLISSCFGTLSFWLTDLGGVVSFYFFIHFMLDGEMAPLSTYPLLLQSFANILPFRYLLSFPLEIFFGRINSELIFQGFAIAVFWAIALFAVNKFLWRIGLNKFQAYGK
jgi:ABC-2 type transport system permease protein